LVIPLVMLGMKQGRELLNGLFDDSGAYPGIRAASLLFAYFIQALAIWLLPRPLFKKAKEADFERLRTITTSNLHLGTIISVLPMMLYGGVMIWVQYRRNGSLWLVILALLIVAAGAWAAHWVIKKGHFRLRWLFLAAVANFTLVFVLLLFGRMLSNNVYWNYFFVGTCMVIQVPILAGIFKRLLLPENRRFYHWLYIGVASTSLGLIAFLSIAENLHFQSPTFILLIITTFYILINDLVIALYILRDGKWFKRGLTLALLAFGYFLFIYKSPIHDVNRVNSPLTSQDRVDFSIYFKAWYLNNIAPSVDTMAQDSIPLYLVAAQGGGSRAGLWTSALLNDMRERDTNFQKRLFAITSASGGSAGTGATLSLWRYLQENPNIPDTTRHYLTQSYAPTFFEGNFLSVSFMQLFINEIGKRFLAVVKKDVTDRNVELQNHEAIAFARSVRRGWHPELKDINHSAFTRIDAMFRKGDDPTLYIGKDLERIPNYPWMPYLSYWYNNSKQPDTRMPLYFPITTNIQNGKSGYCSPIAWDSTLFVDAIDVLAAAEKGREGQSLALVTASSMSQLFPVMNSYTYIPNTGNFMDGGLFENMGLTLQNSLCVRMQKEIEKADYIPLSIKKRLKVRMIFIINAALEPDDDSISNRKNQATATISALGFSSIEGTSTWWMEHFRQKRAGGQPPAELILQTPMTSVQDRLPLGRWLSRRSIDYAMERKDLLAPQIEAALR
jgi:hypothetical protein